MPFWGKLVCQSRQRRGRNCVRGSSLGKIRLAGWIAEGGGRRRVLSLLLLLLLTCRRLSLSLLSTSARCEGREGIRYGFRVGRSLLFEVITFVFRERKKERKKVRERRRMQYLFHPKWLEVGFSRVSSGHDFLLCCLLRGTIGIEW